MASEKQGKLQEERRRILDMLWAKYDIALPSEQPKLRLEIEKLSWDLSLHRD